MTVRNSRVYDLMLVDVREPLEDGEGLGRCMGTSTVWLQRIDTCPMLVSDASQPLIAFGRSPVFLSGPVALPAGADRELVAALGLPAVQKDELPDEMVEGRAAVMHKVPDQQAPSELVRFFPNFKPSDVCRSLTVDFGDESVRLSLGKLIDCEIQGVKVLYGPPVFSPATL